MKGIYEQMLGMSKDAMKQAQGQINTADRLIDQLMSEPMTKEAKDGVGEMGAQLKNIMAHAKNGDIEGINKIKDELLRKHGLNSI